SWQRIANTPPAYLTGVFGVKPDDLWVVGKAYEGQAALMHYDGARWQTLPSGCDQSLLALFGVRRDLLFAAGHPGTILRYDGKRWSAVPSIPTHEKVTGLCGTSERAVWAVGHGGVALHYDGKTWTLLPTQTSQHINSGFCASPKEAWFVGDQGLIL